MSSDYDPNHVHKKVFSIVGGKAVVFNNAGKILLLQRSDKTGLGGKWALPGGALEDDENPFEGIKREIDEEIKITVSDIKTFFVKSSKNDSGDNVVIIGYICRADSENIILNWEHGQYKWLTREEALGYDLTPDAEIFLENLA